MSGGIDPRDLAACEAALRAGSKSFAAASRVLPARVRAPTTALYAFCRSADDAVDDASRGDERRAVESLRGRVERAYSGRPDDRPCDRAFATVVESFAIPRTVVDALVEGFAWDADGRRYDRLDGLEGYATRVAGTVGVMMAILMGARDKDALARACDLGVAMQLTNIARDVGEDARMGRIYLPLAWLRDEGIDADAFLARPVFDPRIARVVARLLACADALYRRADAGISLLPRDCRTAIRAARLIYAEIGREVARAGFDSVTRRAHVSWPRKLWLLMRAWLGRSPVRVSRDAPPIAAARFLLLQAAASGPGRESAP